MPSDDDDHSKNGRGEDTKDGKSRDAVCRDFLNNICNRGSRCKFAHPEDHPEKQQNAADEPYQFCNDFQNQGCHRDNCRYVHAFREDVDRYKRNGDVTLGLARALAALLKGDSINGIPLCKEFQNGHCARGPQCRYWHINREEERRKRFSGRPCGGTSVLPPFSAGAYPPAGGPPSATGRRRRDDFTIDDYGPPTKRHYVEPFMTPGFGAPAPAPPPHLIVDLERRNAELVAEVESLRRELQREKERYDDLMALFRASQGQQQPVPVQRAAPIGAVPTPLKQQQPTSMQQWGTSSAVSSQSQPNWSNKYDWTSN